MTNWARTIWTEARQIGAILGWPPAPGDGVSPELFFRVLLDEGRSHDAALFLGQALPRYEAVLWAARTVASCRPTANAAVMAAVTAWLRDPSDSHRRAAYAEADGTSEPTAAKLCALAVFMSGGSIALDGERPLPAPKEATGKFAAAAVLTATADGNEPEVALARALDDGEKLARGEPEGTR